MRSISCFIAIACLCFAVSPSVFAQNDPEARVAIAQGRAAVTQKNPVRINRGEPAQLTIGSGTVIDAATGTVIGASTQNGINNGSGLADTTISATPISSFEGAFLAQGGPSNGNIFRFSMLGGQPLLGRTTAIPAKISEISLTLLNADGSTLMTVPFDPFEALTLNSPNFRLANYASGSQVQFGDAVQRAEFFNSMAPTWHTVLQPSVVNRVNITIPRFVNIQVSTGHVVQARSYFVGTASDGKPFVLLLNAVFDFFFGNEVNDEINAGNFDSKSLNMTLLPNTFLFSLNVNHPNTPGSCCVLGFHTFFFDPSATPTTRWVTQFASWISPGLFAGNVADVTALSHETSEAINDPFLNNITPRWQFPNQAANSKFCQGNLETGDPVEVLTNPVSPVTIHVNGQPFTFHPQTEALLQWFQMGPASNAIDGTFSFPDESALTKSAVPCPQ